VHTTADGYRLLGLGLFEQLKETGIVAARASLDREQVAEVSRTVMADLNSRDYSAAFLQLAKVLDWAGKFEEARGLLLKNLELFGPDGRTFAQLGRTLARNDRAGGAIRYLELALSAGNDQAWIHGLLGDLYRKQGLDQRAIDAYREELRLDPGNHAAHAHLGLLHVARGDRDSARRHLEEALRLEPGFQPAAANLVALLYDGGQHDEALARGEELLARRPEAHKTRYLVGMILLERGEVEAAARHFEEVLRTEPGFEPARAALDRVRRSSSGSR
jgi:tetratricopeptide (TPR) repeat protein